jgi:hypothetical protein
MYRLAVVVAVVAGILIPAAQAHANDIPGYPKAQRTAEKKALVVAKQRYEIIGIIATCQKVKKNWKCLWQGMAEVNGEWEPVYGRILLQKKSNKVLTGMHWGYPTHV